MSKDAFPLSMKDYRDIYEEIDTILGWRLRKAEYEEIFITAPVPGGGATQDHMLRPTVRRMVEISSPATLVLIEKLARAFKSNTLFGENVLFGILIGLFMTEEPGPDSYTQKLVQHISGDIVTATAHTALHQGCGKLKNGIGLAVKNPTIIEVVSVGLLADKGLKEAANWILVFLELLSQAEKSMQAQTEVATV